MNTTQPNSGDWKASRKKDTVRLGMWTLAWLVTMAVAVFGATLVWSGNQPVIVTTIIINIAVGFGMIRANKQHLQGLDEMHRKIQLEAMALSLGVGLVVGLGYSSLDVTNIITFDAEISHLVILLGLTYAAGVFAGIRRYR